MCSLRHLGKKASSLVHRIRETHLPQLAFRLVCSLSEEKVEGPEVMNLPATLEVAAALVEAWTQAYSEQLWEGAAEALVGLQLDWLACSSQRHSWQPAVPSSLLCVRHLSAAAAEEQGVALIWNCNCMDRTRHRRP